MTPATIAGLCKLAGLDVAALTDHNTCGNCAAFCQACQAYGLLGLPGMELCTAEEVHVVCLLPDLAAADAFSRIGSARFTGISTSLSALSSTRALSQYAFQLTDLTKPFWTNTSSRRTSGMSP